VNQGLIDDGLVDKEKIGGSNYFWSFPGKKDRMAQIHHKNTLEAIEKLKSSTAEAQARLMDAKRGREEEEEVGEGPAEGENGGGDKKEVMTRAAKLRRLETIGKERAALEQELATLKENDPQAMADLKKELMLVTEAANRWTDNIFNCKTYLTKKRGMDKKEACKILGITSEFDCKCVLGVFLYFSP
jgi:hypothetical protein